MAQLLPFTFDTPGIAGLNLQGQTAVLGQEWATKAHNLIIDEQGRLAHRKGTQALASNTTTGNIETLHVGISSVGAKTTYCADDTGAIYELVAGAWVAKYTTSLPSNGNWKFANFNSKVVAWHEDGQKVIQATTGATFAAVAGTSKSGVDVLAAWGRLWVIDGNSLYASDLLVETTMTSQIDLRNVWPAGVDTPVALAEFNGFLVIFGERSIVIYQNPNEATLVFGNFTLIESVEGTGCVERDTIQNVGKDIFFLSHDGIKSLGRVIQEKSMPLNDAVPQGRSSIADAFAASLPPSNITSAYSESTGLYLLGFGFKTVVVDVRQQISDGVYRFTEWDAFGALTHDGQGGLFMAQGDVAFQYVGILDSVSSAGTGGVSIEGEYESGWIDFSNIADGAGPLTKYLKKLTMTFVGGSGATVQYKWATDYSETFLTASISLAVVTDTAKYGIDRYTVGKYGSGTPVLNKTSNTSRSGRVIKVGFKTLNSVSAFAVNRIACFVKVGGLSK